MDCKSSISNLLTYTTSPTMETGVFIKEQILDLTWELNVPMSHDRCSIRMFSLISNFYGIVDNVKTLFIIQGTAFTSFKHDRSTEIRVVSCLH